MVFPRCSRVQVQDYLNTHDKNSKHIVAHLSLIKFKLIKSYLDVCNVNGDNGSEFL